ncbi:hypothetical protein DN062_15565 [Nitrincola tibetensis]|uniref:DUF4168 domain-containing protein n=1 Tax=Nitrincola tibetensis TaxID=2219697 RepID=A0A364NIS2_9GAMM|nr:DUF4168 domain-containing protein [Nitrincola tibetensis]RAU16966.1 hypothetical protein DN062_15565 [Nitrincola tibetensis]
MKILNAGLITALLSFTMVPAVFAETSYPTNEEPHTTQHQESNFTDADIEKFIAVQNELDGIRNEYADRLASAANPDEAAELQQEAGSKMVETVEAAGLSVEHYNAIAMAVQTQPELRDRVEQSVN